MGVLLSLLSLLLVAAAGGGVRAAMVTRVDETTVSYYSPASDVIAYWQTVLPHSPIPPAILEHLSMHAEEDKKATFQWDRHTGGDEKATLQWGHQTNRNEGGDEKATLGWAHQTSKDEGGDEKATLGWGQQTSRDEGGDEKATLGWAHQTSSDEGGDEKATLGWAHQTSRDEGGDEKATLGWGQQTSRDEGGDEKATLGWAHETSRDEGGDEKATLRWAQQTTRDKEGNEKSTLGWSHQSSRDERCDEKATLQWSHQKSKDEGGDEKATLRWGHQTSRDERGDEKATLRWSRQTSSPAREGHRHGLHGTGHNHGPFNLANILFSEAALTPGTKVTPFIEPSVLPTPFLRRDVADSIPMSTKNFTNIMSKFAPMSFPMAGRVWSTLHTCEHPHPLEGERQACATSVESMVELAMSVVGTRDVRAFSSSRGVPPEGLAPPPSRRYAVAAVRAVTAPGVPATTMTCHGVTFPYAVFYCHAVNPTRVYEVTLRRSTDEEDGGAGAGAVAVDEMRVLAVCHLDTSRFDPENPYFVARGLKPGDAAVCHFLSRDSVLWASAASVNGHGQAAAQ